jgi:hypothetical protein
MFRKTLHRSLMLLSILAVSTMSVGNAGTTDKGALPTSEKLARDLGDRLDSLQGLLDQVRDARGEPLRHAAMERHWKGMQEYMAASLKLALPVEGADAGAADCRVVSGQWSALPFPGHVHSNDYLKTMQAHLGKMRQDLIGIHGARGAEALNTALKGHWRSNLEMLQTTRGLGWMYDGWKPAQPGDTTLPDPNSDAAKLTESTCSVCHAVPPSRLHTAAEWRAVIANMNRHMAQSDGGMPACVRMPTAEELLTISDYLAKYAR